MFEFLFGLFWTMITGVLILGFYFGGGNITVNGVPVTQEEFNAMLWPKIFMGIFLLIGIFMLIKGLKKILANAATSAIGQNTYGYIIDTYPNGMYVNGCALYDAKVLVAMPNGETKIFTDNIGKKLNTYYPGVYVSLKVHKNDINILEAAQPERISYNIRNILSADAECMFKNNGYQESVGEIKNSTAETIIVDGVEYVKKDSIESKYNKLEQKRISSKSPFDE